MNGHCDGSDLLWRYACSKCRIHSLQYLADGRTLRAQLSKDDANDRIVLVPSHHIRLTNGEFQRLNDVFDEGLSLTSPVSGRWTEFEKQQQEKSLRPICAHSLKTQNSCEGFFVKECTIKFGEH